MRNYQNVLTINAFEKNSFSYCRWYNDVTDVKVKEVYMYNIPGITGIVGLIILSTKFALMEVVEIVKYLHLSFLIAGQFIQ